MAPIRILDYVAGPGFVVGVPSNSASNISAKKSPDQMINASYKAHSPWLMAVIFRLIIIALFE